MNTQGPCRAEKAAAPGFPAVTRPGRAKLEHPKWNGMGKIGAGSK